MPLFKQCMVLSLISQIEPPPETKMQTTFVVKWLYFQFLVTDSTCTIFKSL